MPSKSYNQISTFEAMATGIILLSSLLLLVPFGYCIETFGIAGQHVMPSDISGRLFSLDYIETIKYYIYCLYIIQYEYRILILQFGESFRSRNANPEMNANIKK